MSSNVNASQVSDHHGHPVRARKESVLVRVRTLKVEVIHFSPPTCAAIIIPQTVTGYILVDEIREWDPPLLLRESRDPTPVLGISHETRNLLLYDVS